MIDPFKSFVEFCYYEKLTGGPDPHMQAVVELSKDLPDSEKIWRAGLYVGFYNVPSAEAVWRNIAGHQYTPELMSKWLEQHWGGLKTRRERRTVKSPLRMSVYLEEYPTLLHLLPVLKDAQFEKMWIVVNQLSHVGRYAATKLCEIWWRMGLINAQCPDIRARGGWSPREALAVLYPEVNHNPYDNKQIEQAEELALDNHRKLQNAGIYITRFEQEVMLCEFKASYSTHRQHPGKSLDSELEYEAKIKDYWRLDDLTEHMKIRPAISPLWALGEHNGWTGVRKELGFVLANYGYTWSDFLYDWKATTDFAHPVMREQ